MPALKFVHLANHQSTNIGNGALIHGTERVLREDLGCPVEFLPEPWDEYTYSKGRKKFDAAFVNLVNQQSDALLVNGAVTLNGVAKYTNTGSRFDLPLELWTKIAKPIIFYGISYRFWPGQVYHHIHKLRETVEYVLARPNIVFGVRNDGTKSWLEALLGFGSDKIISVPDPAVHVPVQDGAWHPELADGKINIVLSLNNEDDALRFGSEPAPAPRTKPATLWQRLKGKRNEQPPAAPVSRKRQFLHGLAQALDAFASAHEVNLILCIHSHEDYTIAGEFVALCSPRLQTQAIVSRGQLKLSQTEYFYDLYARADLALSMRVHSMSPAVGLGTPLIALTSQKRMTDFLADSGIPEFGLDIGAADFSARLIARLHELHADPDGARARLRAVSAALRERTRVVNQRIASLLNLNPIVHERKDNHAWKLSPSALAG